ncbi:DUF4381 domain-containing protein [Thalassomonas sp. M1454]|uniref:DUF4381 domain-containing protein n=1 Tax=Thalassomonas sp. M1454 TaxID=2594477 RepID=UPI00163D912F|nr:DUF4381 domain-containing protein [Thalassomonas sp. M1454]
MDPLAQLKDIHLPEQINQWPIAIGWWLLLLSIIAFIFFVVNKIMKKRKQVKVIKQAQARLSTEQNLSSEQIIATLKWTCMHYFTRNEVAALHSNDLLNYLSDKLEQQHKAEFITKSENALIHCYRKADSDIYAKDLQNGALFWLSHANFFNEKTAIKESGND